MLQLSKFNYFILTSKVSHMKQDAHTMAVNMDDTRNVINLLWKKSSGMNANSLYNKTNDYACLRQT